MKSLDRLMFAQGGLCFFCNAALTKAEASVEHLIASARGGANGDDNCVACCKAVNNLFGSMSLKEKLKVVLNQKGHFKCPNGAGNHSPASKPVSQQAISAVIANLKSRGKARPQRLKTLASTIKSLPSLKLNDMQVKFVIQDLQSSGKIIVNNEQVAYKL